MRKVQIRGRVSAPPSITKALEDISIQLNEIVYLLNFGNALSEYADDTAASAGGIPLNGLYRTGSAIKQRVT